jgi:hypothetical protein
MHNIIQNAQACNLSNPEVNTKSLAQREKAFLKHGAERLGQIIAQVSSGPPIIAELSLPVHETVVPFVKR